MALLKIALLHLIVLAAREKGGLEQEEKGGGGLSDGLRKEHLIQSGDDIKNCCVYGYAHTKPKSVIVSHQG